MKSQLKVFYKFMQDLQGTASEKIPLDIGLSNEQFEQMKAENFVLLTEYSMDKLKETYEFTFRTEMGQLKIYNRDIK